MITKKDKKVLLYGAGVASVALAYFLVVAPGSETRAELKAMNEALAVELEQVREHATKQDFYAQETAVMQTQIDEVLAQFPADIKEETTIMYANMLETESDIYIPNISIGSNNHLYTLGQDAGQTAADGISLYGTPVVYTFTAPYDDMKEVVDTIFDDEEQRNIESITLSYETGSGELVGNMTVNMYSVTGTDKMYVAPSVPPMPLGTDNIFGTLSSIRDDDDAGDEE